RKLGAVDVAAGAQGQYLRAQEVRGTPQAGLRRRRTLWLAGAMTGPWPRGGRQVLKQHGRLQQRSLLAAPARRLAFDLAHEIPERAILLGVRVGEAEAGADELPVDVAVMMEQPAGNG